MNNGEGLQFIVFLIIADAKVKTSISKQEIKTKRLIVTYSSIMYVDTLKQSNKSVNYHVTDTTLTCPHYITIYVNVVSMFNTDMYQILNMTLI